MIGYIALIAAVALLIVMNAYKDREIWLLEDRLYYISQELNKDNTLLYDVVAAYERHGVETPVDGDRWWMY